ncbi:MAG: GspH/FimT family pseudopilin [Acidobacteria bacterium]|nr:GspH/FimT family pseudopilin [Acidobacteriota bacterium]
MTPSRSRAGTGPARSRGYTLVELLFSAALATVLAGIAAPQVLAGLDRSRAWAAARYLAARMAMARAYAVSRSTTVALRFSPDAADVAFQMFQDTNHNGVRTRDIASDIDRPLGAPTRLSELFPGVVIGLGGGEAADAVRIGASDLLSFTALGTATPGTVYVRGRDGLQLAVRITGATGRARVLRYVPRDRTWVEWF